MKKLMTPQTVVTRNNNDKYGQKRDNISQKSNTHQSVRKPALIRLHSANRATRMQLISINCISHFIFVQNINVMFVTYRWQYTTQF